MTISYKSITQNEHKLQRLLHVVEILLQHKFDAETFHDSTHDLMKPKWIPSATNCDYFTQNIKVEFQVKMGRLRWHLMTKRSLYFVQQTGGLCYPFYFPLDFDSVRSWTKKAVLSCDVGISNDLLERICDFLYGNAKVFTLCGFETVECTRLEDRAMYLCGN